MSDWSQLLVIMCFIFMTLWGCYSQCLAFTDEKSPETLRKLNTHLKIILPYSKSGFVSTLLLGYFMEKLTDLPNLLPHSRAGSDSAMCISTLLPAQTYPVLMPTDTVAMPSHTEPSLPQPCSWLSLFWVGLIFQHGCNEVSVPLTLWGNRDGPSSEHRWPRCWGRRHGTLRAHRSPASDSVQGFSHLYSWSSPSWASCWR